MVTTEPAAAGWHGCAVLSSEEHGWEALADFIGQSIEEQDQVLVVGLRAGQVTELLRRLREEQGVDPDPAIADGQLVVMDEGASGGPQRLSEKQLSGLLTARIDHALHLGYRGFRLTGLNPERGIGPYEGALAELVRTYPLAVLCTYFVDDLSEQQLARIRELHCREIIDTAIFDDRRLRITRSRPGWLRLAGRWDRDNHAAALAVVAQAVAAGDRDLDLSSLRSIDPAGLHALLTGVGRVRLRRPTETVQQLAHFLGTQRTPRPDNPGNGLPTTDQPG